MLEDQLFMLAFLSIIYLSEAGLMCTKVGLFINKRICIEHITMSIGK